MVEFGHLKKTKSVKKQKSRHLRYNSICISMMEVFFIFSQLLSACEPVSDSTNRMEREIEDT